ncbi:hypothetical protein BYT27DRAFT_7037358, partial [Phlegmacium glaucopus]
WNEEETTALLLYLDGRKYETEGIGNFKKPVWSNAPNIISHLLTKGPPKTSKMCQTKWSSLKNIYTSIEFYRTASGLFFDPKEMGANIQTETEAVVWNDLVAKKTELKPFRNKGWAHHDIMQNILFSTAARGTHIH